MRGLRGNPWAILITLSFGFFMTLLDLTIVNIAIPSMIESLQASLDEVLWVVNAYVLVLAVLLITAGRLGDLRGQRTMFAAGVAVFTVASLACGLAPNPGWLIAFRAVQGLGAALLMPQTMALIIATFPAQKRGTALGVWGAVAGLATVAGPTLGGLLVTVADWRWIFFVNLPIGVAVLVMTFAFIPDTRMARQHRLDFLGVGLATAGLLCLTFALIEGQRFSWNAGIWALLVASAVIFGIFGLQQRRMQGSEPLIPFQLFRDRNFTVLNGVGALISVGILGFFLPLTIYLQSVLGYSALKAGLVLAPMSIVSMVIAPVAGGLTDKVGGKYILMPGLLLFSIGGAWLVFSANANSNWPSFLPAILIMGVGFGCMFAPLATEAMRGIDPRMAGAASGVNNTTRQLGSVIGSAAVGALLQNRLVASFTDEAAQQAAHLPPQFRAAFVSGFQKAAKSGLDVSGQSQTAPHGVPAQVAGQLRHLGEVVYRNGFVDAMHPTFVLPIVAMLLAAGLVTLVNRTGHKVPGPAASGVSGSFATPAGASARGQAAASAGSGDEVPAGERT